MINEIEFEHVSYATLQDGIYNFKVLIAEGKQSRSGNPMIALTLNVWNDSHPETQIKDWLVPAAPGKIKAFCESIDATEMYVSKKLKPAEVVFKSGMLEIGTREDDQGSMRNFVKKYLSKAQAETIASKLPEPNDEIPF